MNDRHVLLMLVLTATLVSSIILSYLLRLPVLRQRFLDMPNQRSLHEAPVPRSGGLAIHLAFAASVLAFAQFGHGLPGVAFWSGWLLVVAVSMWDDVGHVPVVVRLAVHSVATGALVLTLFGAAYLASAVAVLALIWFLNLFNFMDGMDGLAGAMAFVGALCLAAAGLVRHDPVYAVLLLTIAAAVAGFLVHNLPPARIFMGDAGSVGLGFLLGGLSLHGIARELFDWWFPVLVFLPFIADASFTLFKRACQRKPVWQAHREHAYQTLVLRGWAIRHVLAVYVALMLLCGIGALGALALQVSGWPLFFLAAALFAVFYWGIMRGRQ